MTTNVGTTWGGKWDSNSQPSLPGQDSHMSAKRVVVVGDNCLDLYWIGEAVGLSAEAPVPVVKQSGSLALPGMSGNVQKLLQDLGGIETQLVLAPNAHLPIKNRLVTSDGTQLARWDWEDWCTPLTKSDLRSALEGFTTDVIIISDYNKGALSAEVLKELRDEAEDFGTPLYVDTKNDPFLWIGLPNVTLFPNSVEYARYRDHYDWMPRVVYKQGAAGMSYLEYGETRFTQRAQARIIRNVCGAGDAVLAAWVSAEVRGSLPEDSLSIASQAAGSFVERSFAERHLTSSVLGACN